MLAILYYLQRNCPPNSMLASPKFTQDKPYIHCVYNNCQNLCHIALIALNFPPCGYDVCMHNRMIITQNTIHAA